MAFIEERFPTVYSFEPGGGPMFNVLVTQSTGGQEARSPDWGAANDTYGLNEFMLQPRVLTGRWGTQTGNWPATARGDFNAFMAHWSTIAQGKANGFRFQYWFDNYAYRTLMLNTASGGFVGDGTTLTWQLCVQKTSPGGLATVNKKIFKQLGTHNTSVTDYINTNQTGLPLIQLITTAPILYPNGSTSTPYTPTTQYTIDNNGLVTFTAGNAPSAGVSPISTFYYDYPVRYDMDKPPVSYANGIFTLDQVTLVELRNAV